MTHTRTAAQSTATQRLVSWVQNSAVFADDGRVLSWVNKNQPGFPYDEATALYAKLHSWLGNARLASRLGAVLEESLARNTWLRKHGIGYAFDTALALPSLRHPDPVAANVASWLTTHRVCSEVTRAGWWSQSYGAHLLKALVPLADVGRRSLAEELADELVSTCFDGERFRIHQQSQWTYVHSHCYAVEGLIGLGIHEPVVAAAADWLAGLQNDDGSLPAWIGGVPQEPPADAVAQSVRIWAIVDPERYTMEMARGLGRLDKLQDPVTGGIRYTLDSDDVNSCVSAFALQARLWVQTTPNQRELKWLI